MENEVCVWQMKNWLVKPEGMMSAGRQEHVIGSVCKFYGHGDEYFNSLVEENFLITQVS